MARNVEREIEALLDAKRQQIPRWHDFVERGEQSLSVADHIDLLHRLLGIHAELIIRLAREIDALGGT
jgi:hypothetical protein